MHSGFESKLEMFVVRNSSLLHLHFENVNFMKSVIDDAAVTEPEARRDLTSALSWKEKPAAFAVASLVSVQLCSEGRSSLCYKSSDAAKQKL